MSWAVGSPETLPESAVRNRSEYATTHHRLDPDSEVVSPACPEADYREDAGWTDVPVAISRAGRISR
jgi:hypothetical protein